MPFMLAAIAVTAIAAVTDFRAGRIPNWLTFGAIAAGLAGQGIAGWVHGGFQSAFLRFGLALGGLMFCALAPGIVFWRGGMGAGDVKLFAAIGALCGLLLGIEAQMYSFVIAAVLAPARLVYEGRFLRVFGASLALLANPFRAREKRTLVPEEMMTPFRLGPAVFAGTLLAVVIRLPVSLP
jgi:prepilin peptidase CpaA